MTQFHSFFPLGIYYESSKEPPPEGPPKLHLLIESNEEFRVCRIQILLELHTDNIFLTGGASRQGDQTPSH